jgi:O-glycosyl hydrolase
MLELTINMAEKFQTVRHFGASGCWTLDPIGTEWSLENREELARLLFSTETGIGLSNWRFNIGAGSVYVDDFEDRWRLSECFRKTETEPYDWARHPGQQWFLNAARRYQVPHLSAFTNSPPVWLTKNGHACCDKSSGSTNLREDAHDQFARFLIDVLQHFAQEGIVFDTIEPINEPSWAWEGTQEGCRYNNADIISVIKALHHQLVESGLPTHISAPDTGDLTVLLDDTAFQNWSGSDKFAEAPGPGSYRNTIRDLLGDPQIGAMVGGHIAAHSYWTDEGERNLVELRRAVRENIAAIAPGAEYWMTEYCVMKSGRDIGMDTALHMARTIHHDMVDGNASSWQWWLAVSPHDYKDGLIYTNYRTTGEQDIIPACMLWALGNYSRYIRPGATRIAAHLKSAPDSVTVSAYRNRNGSLVTVLTNHANTEHEVKLTGLQDFSHCRIATTSVNHSLEEAAAAALPTVATLPAESLVTVICE